MIANYHTHTRWCRHATGEIEQYIVEGIRIGLKELAITEHVPLFGDPDPRRIQTYEFDAYNEELDFYIKQYKQDIKVRKGMECEYFPDMMDQYELYRKKYGYEIFLLGHHASTDGKVDHFCITKTWQLEQYAEEVCQGLGTGFFQVLAHPDVFMYAYPRYDDAVKKAMSRIFSCCEKYGIPAEINANGHNYGRGYPCEAVWKDAARFENLCCIIGSDAHRVEDLGSQSVAECRKMAEKYGLHVIDLLD